VFFVNPALFRLIWNTGPTIVTDKKTQPGKIHHAVWRSRWKNHLVKPEVRQSTLTFANPRLPRHYGIEVTYIFGNY